MCGGGVCGRGGGHEWQGAGMCGRYYKIRSMSGRYASYWNAFLCLQCRGTEINDFAICFCNGNFDDSRSRANCQAFRCFAISHSVCNAVYIQLQEILWNIFKCVFIFYSIYYISCSICTGAFS